MAWRTLVGGGNDNGMFEETIREEKEEFCNDEKLRLDHLKEKLLGIEIEFEGRSAESREEFECNRNEKMWRYVEVFEDEREKFQHKLQEKVVENEQFVERQAYLKVQATLKRLRDIEREHLTDAEKKRKMDVHNLHENILKGILQNDLYQQLEGSPTMNTGCSNDNLKNMTYSEFKIYIEKLCRKEKELSELEEILRKSLIAVEETRSSSIDEEISRKKLFELQEEERSTALEREEKDRKVMWKEVDKTLATEVTFQQELLQKIREEEVTYKFLLANQMSQITKSAGEQREKMRQDIVTEKNLLQESLRERKERKCEKIDRTLHRKEEKAKTLTKNIKRLEEHQMKLKDEEKLLIEKLNDLQNEADAKEEKTRVELEAKKEKIEKLMKLEESKQMEELNRKLIQTEMVFNERLLEKEELRRIEREKEEKDLLERCKKATEMNEHYEKLNEEKTLINEQLQEKESLLKSELLRLKEDTQQVSSNLRDDLKDIECHHKASLVELRQATDFEMTKLQKLNESGLEIEEKLKEFSAKSEAMYSNLSQKLKEDGLKLEKDRKQYRENIEKQNILTQKKLENKIVSQRKNMTELENETRKKLKQMGELEQETRMKLKQMNEHEQETSNKLKLLEKEIERREHSLVKLQDEEEVLQTKVWRLQQYIKDNDMKAERRKEITEAEELKENVIKKRLVSYQNDLKVLQEKLNKSESGVAYMTNSSDMNGICDVSPESSWDKLVSNTREETFELEKLKEEEAILNIELKRLEEEIVENENQANKDSKTSEYQSNSFDTLKNYDNENESVENTNLLENNMNEKEIHIDDESTISEIEMSDLEESLEVSEEIKKEMEQRNILSESSATQQKMNAKISEQNIISKNIQSQIEELKRREEYMESVEKQRCLRYKRLVRKMEEQINLLGKGWGMDAKFGPDQLDSGFLKRDAHYPKEGRASSEGSHSNEDLRYLAAHLYRQSDEESFMDGNGPPINYNQNVTTSSPRINFQIEITEKNVTEETCRHDRENNVGKTQQCKRKPFKCASCNRHFKKESHLKRHIQLQYGDTRHSNIGNKYNCDLCGNKYSDDSKIWTCRLIHQQDYYSYNCDDWKKYI